MLHRMPRVTTEVAEVRRESAEAVTLRLDLGGQAFSYRPGQYVIIDPHQFGALAAALHAREAERGKPEGPGYYALSSDGLTPSSLEITVKAKRDGASRSPLPGWLAGGIGAGERVVLEGPGGRYALPEDPPAGVTGFLHLCAGSGVSPNRGMIRHALGRGWPQRHLLIVQDRAEGDALFGAEWEALWGRHPDRFRLRSVFSRAGTGEYMGEDLVRGEMAGWLEAAATMAFLCGPNLFRSGRPGFCERMAAVAGALGIAPGRVLSPA